MKFVICLTIFFYFVPILTLDNGLGLTPPMGWNSWNKFRCNIDEDLIRKTAFAIANSPLKEAGYTYINLDDCWQTARDHTTNVIIADPKRFHNGIKALADYVHSLGLKFGLYSDAGKTTCGLRPGSLHYEKIDAETYASWDVDFLKYDNCYNTDGTPPEIRYTVMRDALNATGRQIFFSMCEWGVDDPALWARPVGNSWRTTLDIDPTWPVILNMLDQNDKWADHAGPGGWNDPDMLEVGNGILTYAQNQAHFSLWALAKSPLIIGCDVTNLSKATLEILTNPEVIAINQDPLGVQGRRVFGGRQPSPPSYTRIRGTMRKEIWAGPLENGDKVVILFNRGGRVADTLTATWEQVGLDKSTNVLVRDLWAHEDLGEFNSSFSALVVPDGVVMVRLTPQAD